MKVDHFKRSIEKYPKNDLRKKSVLASRIFPRKQKSAAHQNIFSLLRVGAVTRSYFEEATISGLKRIVEKNRPLCERIMWLVIMFLASCISVWASVLMLLASNGVPFVTSQVPGTSVNSMPFPAVSICTTNRISRTKVEDFAWNMIKLNKTDGRSFEQTISQLGYLSIFYGNYREELQQEVEKLHDMLGDYDVGALLKNLTPSCEEVLVRCSWNGLMRNCRNLFEMRLTKEGYCCTFNYLRPTDDFAKFENMDLDYIPLGNLTNNGIASGLSVVLNVSEDDYFYSYWASGGVKVMLFHHRIYPDPHTGGVKSQYISPETKVQLTMMITEMETSEELASVSVEKRGCVFAIHDMQSRLYTYGDCLEMCRVKYIQRKCGCTPFNMPKINGRTCNLMDLMCEKKEKVESISYRPHDEEAASKYPELMGGLDCHCLPECSTIDYKIGWEMLPLVPNGKDTLPDDPEDILIYKMDKRNILSTVDFEVFGKVQGVFFRKHTQKKAVNLGLKGWCMNTTKGTVVGQIQGQSKAMNEMKKWLEHTGSPKSIIQKVEFTNQATIQTVSLKNFEIKK